MYKKIPAMHVKIVKVLTRWTWEVYDRHGHLFAISGQTYSRESDARRAFQRLDVLF